MRSIRIEWRMHNIKLVLDCIKDWDWRVKIEIWSNQKKILIPFVLISQIL